jgi:molybdopterin-synthase adenylyltransferase
LGNRAVKITIEYFGPAREAAGVVRELVDIEPPAQARRLISALARQRGGKLAALLLGSDGELSPSVMVAVGDRQEAPDQPIELIDGDEVVVVPPVAGGSGASIDAAALTDEERAIYEWQMWVPGIGEEGQRRLKAASVLVSRVGGLGGVVAQQLAAAGVGRLVIAHGGNVKESDLNRQHLMRYDALGTSRVECAASTLRAFNPHVDVVAVPENIAKANVERLVEQVDVVVSCAPRFEERFLMNEQAVRQRKPIVDSAVYELTGQVTTTLPGQSACLSCRVADEATGWKRRFPIFGAVAGTVGCLGAMEAIKLICGVGEPLVNRLLMFDLREMRFRTIRTRRRHDCPVCGSEE